MEDCSFSNEGYSSVPPGHAAPLSPSKPSRLFNTPHTHTTNAQITDHTPVTQSKKNPKKQKHEDGECRRGNLTASQMWDQTETSVILNPITLINRKKSALNADEQFLLPNYKDRPIIIEVGCGCHYGSNEIILPS